MGIELLITSSAAEGNITTLKKQISESDITVGCYSDDSVKLDSQLLQGSHVRISSEWNADSDEKRLIITNISGNTSIYLDNEALESDEYREIKESTDIRLGLYTLSVRDTSLNYFARLENAKSDFPLENLSPKAFSLDSAMQSILQPKEPVQNNAAPRQMETEHETKPQRSLQAATVSDEPKKAIETSNETTTPEVVTNEIPTLQVPQQISNTADTDNIVSLPRDAIHAEQDRDVTVNITEKQTLFEGVVGTEDIVELNFDAYRLYSISGRIIHHNQPLAGIVLDGGPLGVVHTNENGNYSFENIVEGTNYQINISSKGFMMAKTQVLLGTINHNIEHNLNAIKLSRVTGRIVHDGSPLPSVTLDAGPYGICLTDANGYYHFDNVPENTDLEISALSAGFMFKRTGTAVGVSRASGTAVATPMVSNATDLADKELEDSLAVLVGDGQRVA